MKLGINGKLVSGRVGSYGCAGGGRVVRVELHAALDKPPLTAIIDCPGCGVRHLVRPSWRQPTARDEGLEPEVVIGGETSG